MGLKFRSNNPLFVKTKNNEWYNFQMITNRTFHLMNSNNDQYNQKWGIIGRKDGLFVYTDNNTILKLMMININY